jgi:hypothetical protein
MPNTEAAMNTKIPVAMILRGALMATRAIFRSISALPLPVPHCAGCWLVRDNLTNATLHASNSVPSKHAGECPDRSMPLFKRTDSKSPARKMCRN